MQYLIVASTVNFYVAFTFAMSHGFDDSIDYDDRTIGDIDAALWQNDYYRHTLEGTAVCKRQI
jgi:hypothetical protein